MTESRAERRPRVTRGLAPRLTWLAAALFSVALVAGCATAANLRNGERAEQLQDYDQAVVEYTKAVHRHPNDRVAQRSLERAKLRGAQDHFTRGRRLAFAGKPEEAL